MYELCLQAERGMDMEMILANNFVPTVMSTRVAARSSDVPRHVVAGLKACILEACHLESYSSNAVHFHQKLKQLFFF